MFNVLNFLKNTAQRKNNNSLPKVATGKNDAIFLCNDPTKLFSYAEMVRAESGEEPDYYEVKTFRNENGFEIKRSTVQKVIYILSDQEEQTETEEEASDLKQEQLEENAEAEHDDVKQRLKEVVEKHKAKAKEKKNEK